MNPQENDSPAQMQKMRSQPHCYDWQSPCASASHHNKMTGQTLQGVTPANDQDPGARLFTAAPHARTPRAKCKTRSQAGKAPQAPPMDAATSLKRHLPAGHSHGSKKPSTRTQGRDVRTQAPPRPLLVAGGYSAPSLGGTHPGTHQITPPPEQQARCQSDKDEIVATP